MHACRRWQRRDQNFQRIQGTSGGTHFEGNNVRTCTRLNSFVSHTTVEAVLCTVDIACLSEGNGGTVPSLSLLVAEALPEGWVPQSYQ